MPAQPGPRSDQIQPDSSANVGDVMKIGLDGKPAFGPESFTQSDHSSTDHTGLMGVNDFDSTAHSSTDHTGIMGVGGGGPFGTGGLGNVTISSLIETSGDLNYNTLTVTSGGTLTCPAKRKLVVRSVGYIDVQTGGAIHVDGRGWSGGNGGHGATSISSASVDGLNSEALSPFICAGGGGGGAGTQPGTPSSTGAIQWGGFGGNSFNPTPDDFARSWSHVQDRNLVGGGGGSRQRIHLPANTLRSKGDFVSFEFHYSTTGGYGAFTNLDLDINGVLFNLVADSAGGSPGPDATFRIFGKIFYQNSTTARIIATGSVVSSTSDTLVKSFPNINPSNDNIITFNVIESGASGAPSNDALLFASLTASPLNLVEGGQLADGTTSASAGSNGSAMSADSISRATSNLASFGNGLTFYGAGGGGGGGQHDTMSGAGSPGGAGGSGSGSDLGDGSNGSTGASGDGGGGGGAGGGHLNIWCGGNLTVNASARISADGGDGGDAGAPSSGGGGGGGGGGFMSIFHSGTYLNSGTVSAAGGTGGAGNTAGGNGAAGVIIVQEIA